MEFSVEYSITKIFDGYSPTMVKELKVYLSHNKYTNGKHNTEIFIFTRWLAAGDTVHVFETVKSSKE